MVGTMRIPSSVDSDSRPSWMAPGSQWRTPPDSDLVSTMGYMDDDFSAGDALINGPNGTDRHLTAQVACYMVV